MSILDKMHGVFQRVYALLQRFQMSELALNFTVRQNFNFVKIHNEKTIEFQACFLVICGI